MAKDETVPLSAGTLKADADALAALKKISDYKPSNDKYTLDLIEASSDALDVADEAFAQVEAAWQTGRDAHVAAQWAFHNMMLGGKKQVVAQYGDDSDQAQAVGLTKKSEYAKPTSKKTPDPATKK
jgi:thioredoxin-like negative regulator of GroEL